MKIIIYLLLALFYITACNKKLELTPLDMLSDKGVYRDKSLTDAFLLDIYKNAKFQELGGQDEFNMGLIAGIGGEARPFGDWQTPYEASIKVYDETGAGPMDYWPFSQIRNINDFIKGVTESLYEEEFKATKIAEARFLRAWAYFQMVKRFGGVPIITTAASIDAGAEELYPERNTEKEVYDFIGAEMDYVVDVLPTVQPSSDAGRVSKWAALALKSRAMLYAASIARFGTVQLNGLVGIPASDADAYYLKSYEASASIINQGGFVLYNKFPTDKERNFAQLFIDEANNTEVIFEVVWDVALNKGHNWDNLCTPAGFNASWNSNFGPFLELVDLFDNIDGTSGELNRSLLTTANQWDIEEVFGKRDPRFKASFFYHGSMWQGKPALFHSSTYYTENGVRQQSTNETFIIPGSQGTVTGLPGWPGKAPNRNTLRTGLHIRKRVDETLLKPGSNLSGTNFRVFRLGEIMLNHAEAAFHLDKNDEALSAINQIRDRAGMPGLTSIDENKIRKERQVELAFEEHRFWDLKRWRIAVETLDGKRLQGLNFDYDYDTKKYIITLKNAEGQARVFKPRNYYFALGIGRISENPNFVENPDY